MNNDYYDPCLDCRCYGMCDGWEAVYCCKRCKALGLDHYYDCDSMDI